MILVDPPAWPAHDTLWSHLVSDRSLTELHDFAAGLGIGRRAFDLDHYDIPASRHQDAVDAGAIPLGGGDLTRRLLRSGLRVPGRDRAVLKGLRRRWLLARPDDYAVVDDLLTRWREPHRTYHGPTHLAETLAALDLLTADDGPDHATRRAAELALWFHDAVHDGASPQDENASAELAVRMLSQLPADDRSGPARTAGPDVVASDRALSDSVAALVRMTARHDPAPDDAAAALVSDADLAILGADADRYDAYTRQIRAEYAQVPDEQFRIGRAAVLDQLLALPTLYATEHGRRLWSTRAAANLHRERASLR